MLQAGALFGVGLIRTAKLGCYRNEPAMSLFLKHFCFLSQHPTYDKSLEY